MSAPFDESRAKAPNSPAEVQPARPRTAKAWVTMTERWTKKVVHVLTEEGSVIPCEQYPPYSEKRMGLRFRAEVIFEHGTATRAIFKSFK